MTLTIRRAETADRQRILEISLQIWDGHDYVPSVIDQWLADDASELAVAVAEDDVIAFARRTWLMPGYAWLQGIRSDPAHRGRGAGRAITEHFIRQAGREGADTIALSTYIDNAASIHIITSYGFRRTASFVLAETERIEPGLPATRRAAIRSVDIALAREFVGGSAWNMAANGFYVCDWTVYPFARSPETALARTPDRVGLFDKNDTLRSLLCLSDVEEDGYAFVSFLDGHPGDFASLLDYATRELGLTKGAAMLPQQADLCHPAYEFLVRSGWTPWRDGTPDVFAYELTIAPTRGPTV